MSKKITRPNFSNSNITSDYLKISMSQISHGLRDKNTARGEQKSKGEISELSP